MKLNHICADIAPKLVSSHWLETFILIITTTEPFEVVLISFEITNSILFYVAFRIEAYLRNFCNFA